MLTLPIIDSTALPYVWVGNFNECPAISVALRDTDANGTNWQLVRRLGSGRKFRSRRKMNAFSSLVPRLLSRLERSRIWFVAGRALIPDHRNTASLVGAGMPASLAPLSLACRNLKDYAAHTACYWDSVSLHNLDCTRMSVARQGGSGTTGLVADRLGRDAILIELSPEYSEMARKRIAGDAPLLAEVS